MDSTDSVGTIVARIEEEVPSVLAATNTPGASIALIHDRACVWTGGFGVTNSETRKPVKPHNVFEAYSLTKPLLAFRALKMVEDGTLGMDRSLQDYVPTPYLGPGGEAITLRMVLSHTSGLSDDVEDRAPTSSPGQRWSYSTCGYFYLQHIIESVSESSIGDNLKANILEPFRMQSSCLTTAEMDTAQLVQGHRKKGAVAGNREINLAHADGLLTTSEDYAQFVVETTIPSNRTTYHLLEATELDMLRGHVRLEESIQWGLGWGLQETQEASYFWHFGGWEDGPFYNFVLGDRDREMGLVVLTNGGSGEVFEPIVKAVVGDNLPVFP